MDLLARREHSRQELRRKLYQRFSDTDVIEQVLEKLIDDQLLSDARFAESYTSMRRKAGFGPVRISAELRERGVSESIIARHVEPNTAQWYRQAALVRAKKFSESTELSTEERAKQSRFLQYRGFTYEHIAQVFNNEET
ncbi:regulatory protein RecX [bacterium]|nr:regulatory protein RecX [bacterium]